MMADAKDREELQSLPKQPIIGLEEREELENALRVVMWAAEINEKWNKTGDVLRRLIDSGEHIGEPNEMVGDEKA